MTDYRLYLTDDDGRFIDVHADAYRDDGRALTAAASLTATAAMVEVWERGRFVGIRARQSRALKIPSLSHFPSEAGKVTNALPGLVTP